MLRQKPSSKARTNSYQCINSLFSLLGYLGLNDQLDDDADPTYDHVGWKNWVIKYTPIDKRGGPSNG